MRLRLSQLPVMGVDSDMYFLHEKYWSKVNYADTKREKHPDEMIVECYVNAHNNTPNLVPITTNDVIVHIDGKQISPYNEKYPILLIKLRSNDRFKCHMKGVLGLGDRNIIWGMARNSYYDELDDKGKKTYEFTIEGNGHCDESEIMIRSCKHLIKKMSDLKKDLENKISTKQILPEKKIFFKLEKEDHTIGELLNYHFQDHSDIIASGLSKPDHLIKAVLIKVTASSNVTSPLDAMMESIDIIINKFSHIGKLLSDMYNIEEKETKKTDKSKKNIKSK
jgi:DNA-directed RNA polymerase subunit L